jgi:hypothetical protein
MRSLVRRSARVSKLFGGLPGLAGLTACALLLVSCGGQTSRLFSESVSGGAGTITVTLSDPPTCAFPNGSFEHVFITIRSVQANPSATAGDNSPGWQELAPQLNSQPVQIDLFALAPNACLLATLGSNKALPAGTYQQIRLLLVPNTGGAILPANNACDSQGFNCVVLHDHSIHQLALSTDPNTGLKIPPGQIVGGPISVGAGQNVDLNIDFNSCASIVQEATGQFRLRSVLTAGQVSTTSTGISGRVVDAATSQPIRRGTVIVALEQQDNIGTDVIFRQTVADSAGNFNFCPLPSGTTFDVVAVAIAAGVAYDATVALNVPSVTNLGTIPLSAETPPHGGPATLQGIITATTGTGAATIDASVSALQTVPAGAVSRSVTIPAEDSSLTSISVETSLVCPARVTNASCAAYALIEPASNPRIGVFRAGNISYADPAAGDVLYAVRADAFAPLSGGTRLCSPSSQTTNLEANNNALRAIAGTTTTVKQTDFSGCL